MYDLHNKVLKPEKSNSSRAFSYTSNVVLCPSFPFGAIRIVAELERIVGIGLSEFKST